MGIEMVKIVDNKQKYHEDKEYLICIVDKNDGTKDWVIVKGRTSAYEWIKDQIENIELEESFIAVEGSDITNRKSIYKFMKYVGDMKEDNFDIDDYLGESNHYQDNIPELKDDVLGSSVDKISMEDILNGNIQTNDLH